MIRKLLTQIHLYIGITAGTLLAFNGITGAMMAFRPQLLEHFGPEAQQVAPLAGSERLSPDTLLQRALAASPGRIPTSVIVDANPTAPFKVRFAVAPPQMRPGAGAGPGARPGPGFGPPPGPGPGPVPGAGPGAGPGPGGPGPGSDPPGPRPNIFVDVPPNPSVLVNPYTGALLPEANGVSRFFESLEHAHRGMWLKGPLGTAMRVTLAYCVLMLIFMALSGLYLRWPKSRKLDWRTWFKIHFKLKGPAFLYSLHTVIGTCVLLIYLITAHTGLMISRRIPWYRDAAIDVREALGLSGLPREPLRFESISPEGLKVVWRAFQQQQPTYRVARVDFPVKVSDPFVIRSGTQSLSIDPGNGALVKSTSISDQDDEAHKPDPPGGEANVTEPIFKAFLNGNPLMHTGTRWGLVGQTVMMCAALCMPILFVTGWMRYWQRRKRRHQG